MALRLSVAVDVGEGLGLGLGDTLAVGVATGDFVLSGEGFTFGLLLGVAGVASLDVGAPGSSGNCAGVCFTAGEGVGDGLTSGGAVCLICEIDPKRPEGV